MSKLPAFILLGLIVLGVGGYYLFTQRNKISSDTPTATRSSEESINPTPKPSTPDSLMMGGSSYLDKTGFYSFLYPNDFKMDEQNEGKQVRIYKNGPSQKGQTEMYDGVIMVFEAISLGDKNLNAWTDDYIKSTTTEGTVEIIGSKKEFSVKNYPGYSFKTRGLGEAQYYILQKDISSKNALMITTLVQDPTGVGFQKQVDGILSNLQLLK